MRRLRQVVLPGEGYRLLLVHLLRCAGYLLAQVLQDVVARAGDAGAEEFRLLRSAGAQPGQLARAVGWESLIVTCAGALLGTGIAAASLTAMGKAVTGELWFAYSLPQYLGLVAVCAVSGLVAGLVSTRKARNGPLVS
ncbi:ABC transporter permease [Nonomuraea sp. NPDC049141]|uniref:ABC transporter permease n=1 Tax=Nonomuraea sp. NPDC049141 TaxID=3155500 RepID=UPI0033E4C940